MNYARHPVSGVNLFQSRSRRPIGGAVKRIFDFSVALVLIIGLLPLLVGCCLLVFTSSRGPVLFRHRRIGFSGRKFTCLKFRTMEVDAEQRLLHHLATDVDAQREWQANHKLKKDPRITRFGDLMRRSSVDELPQLLNVLIGDMSIVGPRPIVVEEIQKYGEHFDIYTTARPGLTGLWQINGRNTTTYPQRVAYDVQYLRNWTFMRDMQIIMRTFVHLIDRSGAY